MILWLIPAIVGMVLCCVVLLEDGHDMTSEEFWNSFRWICYGVLIATSVWWACWLMTNMPARVGGVCG